jgi:hypothetical protein
MSVLTSHHTVWLHCSHCAARAERYALDGERLVVFGDRAFAHVSDGTRAFASVHEIAGGPALVQLSVRVREVEGSHVDRQVLLELLDHVPLGRYTEEVEQSLARHSDRRLLELRPE